MDFLNETLGFTEVSTLPRELSTNELLGRRIFIEINKVCPKVHTKGEVTNWSNYSVYLENYIISFKNLPTLETIHYKYNLVTNLLTLCFDENCSFLEGRTLTKHLQKELYKCRMKKKNK